LFFEGLVPQSNNRLVQSRISQQKMVWEHKKAHWLHKVLFPSLT